MEISRSPKSSHIFEPTRKYQKVARSDNQYSEIRRSHMSAQPSSISKNECREITLDPVASAALTKCLIQATPRKITQVAVPIWWKENPKTSSIRRSGDWAKTSFAPLCRFFPPGGRQLRSSEELFFSIIEPLFCQHGWRPHSPDPANAFGVVCQQRGCLYSTACPKQENSKWEGRRSDYAILRFMHTI